MRTTHGYDAFAQYLTAQGFALIEIDQRGTSGYGEKFAAAGDQAVAGAMADDLIDGLDWLVAEGLVDAKRVALSGQDTGGLLAVHALARYPARFAAWVNFWTVMNPEDLPADEYLFGRYSEAERKTRFGSVARRSQYNKQLNPLPLLPQIKVPSFHYYSLILTDSSAVRHLAKHCAAQGSPTVFKKGKKIAIQFDRATTTHLEYRAESLFVWPEIADFLRRTLLPAAAPVAASP